MQSDLRVAASASVGVATASDVDDTLYYSVENFLAPPTLWQADAASGAHKDVKALPARFDASRDDVEQFEVASADGTKIPYFVVHPKGMKLDGSNPTLLYAYGGFQVSELPTYSANIGKLWLEHGGVYVLANIRGGGEFGPVWHDAGLKTKRQIIYDDFAAVAKDLIARKITSPRRLGIEGGSNGGVVMGVEFHHDPGPLRPDGSPLAHGQPDRLMDRAGILARFDIDTRADPPSEPGLTREWAGGVLRGVGAYNFIGWWDLTPAAVDDAIASQTAFFRARGEQVEWKGYSHDRPANLESSLAAAGWEAEEIENFVVFDLDAGEIPAIAAPGVEVRRIQDMAGVEDYVAANTAAFGYREGHWVEALTPRLRDPSLEVYVAYADGAPLAAGRL